MSISQKNSGFALELLVGIQDEFNNKSVAIQKEAKKLESEVRNLQKTTGDIGKFQKAQKALEELEDQQIKNAEAIEKHKVAIKGLKKESGDTAQLKSHQQELRRLEKNNKEVKISTNEYERELRRLKRSLSETGVDLNNLSSEETQLKTKIDKTTQALKEQTQTVNKLGDARSKMENFGEKMGLVAGAVTAAGILAYRGNDMQKHTLMYAARTGTDISEVNSEEQQKFRTDLVKRYGSTSGEIFTAQAIATQQGLSDEESQELTKSILSVRELYDNYDPQEIARAIANTAKSFGVSIQEAHNRIMDIRTQAGDDKGDLLDTFAEYSPLIGDKLSLDQYSAILMAGRKAGVWNYDKLGDSLKGSFQERFSDIDEFRKLVGHNDKAGVIGLIEDENVRNNVFAAAYKMRQSVNSGQGQGEAYANFMQSLIPVMESDQGIVKNILQAAGGTILSEDVGNKGIFAMTEALNNPEKYLNKEYDLYKVADSVQTTFEKGKHAAMASQSVLDASTARVISSQDHLAEKVSELSQSFTDFVIENPAAGYAGVIAEIAAIGLGGGAAWKILKKRLPGGVTDIVENPLRDKDDINKPNPNKGGRKPRLSGVAKMLAKAGVTAYGASLIPDFAPVKIGRANERDDRASFFGMTSSETGRLGIDQTFLPKKTGIMDVWDEWFGTTPEVKAVEELVTGTPTAPTAAVTPNGTMVQITYSPQINIGLTGASQEQAEVLSTSLVDALRNATPELEQQLRDVMSDILKGNDYLNY